MTLRTIATTIDLSDFDRLDGTTGSFCRVAVDAHNQIGVDNVGRGGIGPT